MIKALDYTGYDFIKNHDKNFPYVKLNMRDLLNENNNVLRAGWELDIPIDTTCIYDSKSRKIIRNKTLKKFIESLEIYEWITINLENKTIKVEDDAICWGFKKQENSGGKGIMSIEKDKNGNHIYKYFDL